MKEAPPFLVVLETVLKVILALALVAGVLAVAVLTFDQWVWPLFG